MSDTFITPQALLDHWQGHRRLTRRVIDAFPDDKLFTFSLGSMRPFGALALEMLGIALPMVRGIVDDKWDTSFSREPRPKSEILRLWDDNTQQMNASWTKIPPGRFQETMKAFGQYRGQGPRPGALRDRQRDSPSWAGLRVPAGPRHRAATVLRATVKASKRPLQTTPGVFSEDP